MFVVDVVQSVILFPFARALGIAVPPESTAEKTLVVYNSSRACMLLYEVSRAVVPSAAGLVAAAVLWHESDRGPRTSTIGGFCFCASPRINANTIRFQEECTSRGAVSTFLLSSSSLVCPATRPLRGQPPCNMVAWVCLCLAVGWAFARKVRIQSAFSFGTMHIKQVKAYFPTRFAAMGCST